MGEIDPQSVVQAIYRHFPADGLSPEQVVKGHLGTHHARVLVQFDAEGGNYGQKDGLKCPSL